MHRRLRPLISRIRTMPVYTRIIVGILLLIGGMLWILPILGLWMIPLGLLVLSIDFPWARRGYLSLIVWLRKFRKGSRRNKNGQSDTAE